MNPRGVWDYLPRGNEWWVWLTLVVLGAIAGRFIAIHAHNMSVKWWGS